MLAIFVLMALLRAACALLFVAASSLLQASAASSPLLRGLSLRDRIAQLIIVRGYGDYPPSDNAEYKRFIRWITVDHVGGFIVAGRIRNGSVIPAQPYEMAAFINHMQRLAKLPLLIGSDFERGASMRVAGTARFPHLMAFGAAHDLEAMHELGAATAREAHALGVTWVFAPDADVNNNPDNPIINVRSYGEDPKAVADGVSAFIEGAHADPRNYVMVTAKHFPGHGDTAEDSHLQLAKLDETKERIEALELVPFRAAIAHGIDSIMTAHVAVPAFEPDEIPATVSHNILTGLLKDELGFKGIVVTDAMEMQGVAALYSSGEAAVRAIEAGADVVLMPTDPTACIRAIEAAVLKGQITRKQIDLSAAKILAAKQRTGLFRSRHLDLDTLADSLDDRKLDSLAQSVADRAVTLVKDENHLFPLPNPDGTCLVTMTDDAFSTHGEVLARTLRQTAHSLQIFETNAAMSPELLAAIGSQTTKCKQIYVAAFVTVSANRGSVDLQGGLTQFLKDLVHGPAPVALVTLGNPYLLRDVPEAGSYAATFSSTLTSEAAAAKAILGDIAIIGKMPVSIPGLVKIGDGLDVPASTKPASNGAE